MGNIATDPGYLPNRHGHIALSMGFSATGMALLKRLLFVASSYLVCMTIGVIGFCFSHGKGPFCLTSEGLWFMLVVNPCFG